MNTSRYKTTNLGKLVARAFDDAACYSNDPKEVSRLATRALEHIFLNARTRKPLVITPGLDPRMLGVKDASAKVPRRSRSVDFHGCHEAKEH